MADDQNGQERTEKPSEKRRQEARKKGNVAKSAELNSAAILLTGTGFLFLAGGRILEGIITVLKAHLRGISTVHLDADTVYPFLVERGAAILSILAPLFVTVFVIAIAVNVGQVGLLWATESIKPKFEKLNLIKGAQRLVSIRSLVEFLKSLIKLTIIGLIVYFTLASRVDTAYLMLNETLWGIFDFISGTAGEVMFKVALVMLLIAAADYAYQRYEHEKKLKMTKEEVKEESKTTEGNPQIKARVREIQRAATRRRMMTKVPEADVVITNPIRFAIALKYDPAVSSAPIILAKGTRKVAARIREIADEHNIPIVQNPPLARLLYDQGELGKEVPIDAYQAVAEVLGFVYQMQNRKLGNS